MKELEKIEREKGKMFSRLEHFRCRFRDVENRSNAHFWT